MGRIRQGNYTVEATFIMIIVVGIIIGMCMFVMKRHDDAVITSLVQYGLNEEGDVAAKKEERIRSLLKQRLLLTTVREVKVTKEATGFRADVVYDSQGKTARIHPRIVKLSAVKLMWDYTVTKEALHEIKGDKQSKSSGT